MLDSFRTAAHCGGLRPRHKRYELKFALWSSRVVVWSHRESWMVMEKAGGVLMCVGLLCMHLIVGAVGLETGVGIEGGVDVFAAAAGGSRGVVDENRLDSALLRAAKAGETGEVKQLLESGEDPNGVSGDGKFTPLIAATMEDHDQIVELLLAADAKVDLETRQKYTALHVASIYGSMNAFRLLLGAGADPNKKTGLGFTPLLFACSAGRTAVAVELIKAGGDMTSRAAGYDALQLAAGGGSSEVIRVLLDAGANPNSLSSDGLFTPLSIAALKNHASVIPILLKAGATINGRSKIGNTALHQASFSDSIEVVSLLLNNEADPNIRNYYGYGPIHVASEYGYVDVVKKLIDTGVSASSKGGNGNTPLILATAGGHLNVVKLLLEKGADVHDGDIPGDSTALTATAQMNQPAIAQILINAGADIDHINANGLTPLYVAAFFGSFEAIEVLVSNGADKTIVGTFYDIPRDALCHCVASRRKHCDLVNCKNPDRMRELLEPQVSYISNS